MLHRFLLFAASLACFTASAQNTYTATAYEFIFSSGHASAADSIEVQNLVRFSGFNYGTQLHHDFNNNVGLVGGVHVRNIGTINKVDTLRIKQRAYALGIPIGLKLGNIASKWYVTPGAEAEFMLNYKVKEFIRGRKVYKHNEWFSDDVNMFNPSVFLQVSLGGLGNVKLKYYLLNFLTPVEPTDSYKVHVKGGSVIPAYTQQSKMFYVSYVLTLWDKDRFRKKKQNEEAPIPPPQPTDNRSKDA